MRPHHSHAPSLRVATPLAVILLAACRPPPDAPTELDALCGFLFDHLADERPDALVDGLENLSAWLDGRMDEVAEGYAVTALAQEAVDVLDERDRDLTGLQGAAVGTDVRYTVDDVAPLLVTIEPMALFPDGYVYYEREHLTDPHCFVDRGCDWQAQRNEMETKYPLGLVVHNENQAELRWVETAAGPAIVHRTWLVEPADINVDWLRVPEQYYLNVVLPRGDGHRRVQATWMVAEVLNGDIPEGIALNLVISSMQSGALVVEAYYDER